MTLAVQQQFPSTFLLDVSLSTNTPQFRKKTLILHEHPNKNEKGNPETITVLP
jgi:hypothetical protein